MSLILLSSKTFQVISIRQKNTLVSRNASDEKNLHPGGLLLEAKLLFLALVEQ